MDSKKRKSILINRYSLISNLDTALESDDTKFNEEEIPGSKRKVTTSQGIRTFCRIRPIEGKNGINILI
jgi:hypothetical protein